MKKILIFIFAFKIFLISNAQNNDIPLLQKCESQDNPLSCSYFTIHNLIQEKLNSLNASSIELEQEDELIISTILKFGKDGKIIKKYSILHSDYINANLEFEELLETFPSVVSGKKDKGKLKISFFKNTFYFKYYNNSFEFWSNTNAKKEDFKIPEKVPIYEGCKPKWSNKKLRDCMSRKIAKHVYTSFNSIEISKKAGLTSGTDVKLLILFTIDENGKIKDVEVKTPLKEIEKEAIKIVNSLGKIKPGFQGNKTIPVPYTLPIRFIVSF